MNRVRILKLLQQKKMCVCELHYILEITQPAISKHLKKLQKAGLIKSEQDGLWKNYFCVRKGTYAKTLLELLDQWLNDDSIIVADRDKAQMANREAICHKQDI